MKQFDLFGNELVENRENEMEHSGLVIIDFNKAIEYGYVKLADEIANLYFEDYEK